MLGGLARGGGQGQAGRGPPPTGTPVCLERDLTPCSISQVGPAPSQKNQNTARQRDNSLFYYRPRGGTAGDREGFLNAARSEGFPEPEQCLLTQAGALNCRASVLLQAGCKLGARNKVSGAEGRGWSCPQGPFFLLGPSLIYSEHSAFPLSKYWTNILKPPFKQCGIISSSPPGPGHGRCANRIPPGLRVGERPWAPHTSGGGTAILRGGHTRAMLGPEAAGARSCSGQKLRGQCPGPPFGLS